MHPIRPLRRRPVASRSALRAGLAAVAACLTTLAAAAFTAFVLAAWWLGY